MIKIAERTVLFDRDNDEEIDTLEGVHPLPVGSVIISTKGDFLVEQVRLTCTEVAHLWLDVRRAKASGRGYVPEE